ncbi:MAG: glycosyltransferase [Patescibacteria group bacterium]
MKVPMPTLSVVIPTKNEEEFLPRLLRSIKQQSLQPKEVIVADANSDDRTREIAAAFGAKIVDGGMPGPGRNRGAEAASGDLIFFFDADVELKNENFLKTAVEEMAWRNLDVVTADVVPIEGNKYDDVSHQIYNTYVRLWGRFHPHTPGFCILVKKDLHQRIGGFDETVTFLEDHDYAYRSNKTGRFGFLSDAKIHVSTRRQERDGRFSMATKYLLAELHYFTLGPIRHNAFNYTFGYPKKQKYGGKEQIF